MSSMTRRHRSRNDQQQAPEPEWMLAGARVAGALGNQDLLDLALPPPAPDEDQELDPWLVGQQYRTAEFLAGLRATDGFSARDREGRAAG